MSMCFSFFLLLILHLQSMSEQCKSKKTQKRERAKARASERKQRQKEERRKRDKNESKINWRKRVSEMMAPKQPQQQPHRFCTVCFVPPHTLSLQNTCLSYIYIYVYLSLYGCCVFFYISNHNQRFDVSLSLVFLLISSFIPLFI